MRRLHVLHVLGRMELGGAELRLVEVLEHLSPEEFRVDVCALSGLPGSLDARVEARGGAVVPLKLDLAFPLRFLRLLRHRQYDVVHAHVLHTSGPILALAALAGVRSRVAHFQSMRDEKAATLSRRIQTHIKMGLIDRCATDIIACSEGSMDAVWHPGWRDDPRCQVIYDGVATDRFEVPVRPDDVRTELGVPESARLFLHIGYTAVEKNHPRLLGIFAAIVQRDPSATLVLAGDGTDAPDGVVAEHVRALGLAHRVIALGVRRDVPRLLKAADVVLFPSLREGLPGVVLEATLSGVPVLATDLPGVREIAERLPGVFYLRLTESDAAWADLALRLPGEAARLRLGDGPVERFRPTVFHIDRAADAHRTLWLAAGQQP
jgi:glycosyltransferase involved in cell wall biosynthesis